MLVVVPSKREIVDRLHGRIQTEISGRVISHVIAVYMKHVHSVTTDLPIDPVKLWNASVAKSFRMIQLLEVFVKAVDWLDSPHTELTDSDILYIKQALDRVNTDPPLKITEIILRNTPPGVHPDTIEDDDMSDDPWADPWADEDDDVWE